MLKNFTLELEGFFTNFSIVNVPQKSGVYFVFAGVMNAEDDSCTLARLLYIGGSADVKKRLEVSENRSQFDECLETGESLFYAYALVDETDRVICEKGLIRHFADRFGGGLVNVLGTQPAESSYDVLNYQLTGAIPRFFSNSDTSFSVNISTH